MGDTLSLLHPALGHDVAAFLRFRYHAQRLYSVSSILPATIDRTSSRQHLTSVTYRTSGAEPFSLRYHRALALIPKKGFVVDREVLKVSTHVAKGGAYLNRGRLGKHVRAKGGGSVRTHKWGWIRSRRWRNDFSRSIFTR